MLDVKVDLNPYGFNINTKTIARILIANVTQDSRADKHKYLFLIHEHVYQGEDIFGVVSDWDRNQSVINLLGACLEERLNINDNTMSPHTLPEYEFDILKSMKGRLKWKY